MDIYEIVTKLIGPITPIGESHTDAARYQNLKDMTMLMNKLLIDINAVSSNKNSPMDNVKKAGAHANDTLRIWNETKYVWCG